MIKERLLEAVIDMYGGVENLIMEIGDTERGRKILKHFNDEVYPKKITSLKGEQLMNKDDPETKRIAVRDYERAVRLATHVANQLNKHSR